LWFLESVEQISEIHFNLTSKAQAARSTLVASCGRDVSGAEARSKDGDEGSAGQGGCNTLRDELLLREIR
jgi:hypothetical protein